MNSVSQLIFPKPFGAYPSFIFVNLLWRGNIGLMAGEVEYHQKKCFKVTREGHWQVFKPHYGLFAKAGVFCASLKRTIKQVL